MIINNPLPISSNIKQNISTVKNVAKFQNNPIKVNRYKLVKYIRNRSFKRNAIKKYEYFKK